MRVTEKVLFILAAVNIVSRIMLVHVPAIAFVMPIFALSFLYQIFGFALLNNIRLRDIFRKTSYSGKPILHIVGAIVTGLILSVSCIAVLFKFMSWPGYFVDLLGSFSLCLIVFIISIIKVNSRHRQYYLGILSRIVVAGVLCVTLLIIPRKTFMRMLYRDHPAFIEAEDKAIDNPQDPELERKAWNILYNDRTH